MTTELHILNGDIALEHWKKCEFKAEYLVWKETYLEGPLPPTDDLHVFRKARAGYLSTFAELSGISEEKLYKHLQDMDNAILDLPPEASLMLWFDACIFDQTILMRILYLLRQKAGKRPHTYLYNSRSNVLVPDDFQRGNTEKILLPDYTINAAAAAWNAYRRQDAAAMQILAQQTDLAILPNLQKALLRCAEDVPDSEGLTRTRRQMLQIISGGKHSFAEIFRDLKSFEEHPFLGDTACARILAELVKQGKLKQDSNGYYLTD